MEITKEEKLKVIQDRIGYFDKGIFVVNSRGLVEVLLELIESAHK